MFNRDFYPTPESLIHQMLEGYDLHSKTVLEPSAGKGDIVDVLLQYGAQVIACEKHPELAMIVENKCKLLANDFLTVTAEQVSHVQFIVMNPPFSEGARHILHAFNIAPPGCRIVALCNAETMERSNRREYYELQAMVENYGAWENIGDAFSTAERKTRVEIALIRLQTPADNYEQEFEGFFMGEDMPEQQENGIMSYNAIRDVVNRYVAAVKLFDKQIEVGLQMDSLVETFKRYEYDKHDELNCFRVGTEEKAEVRAQFKKALQKRGWQWVFDKMNLQKVATRGLREDINKFVEQQTQIPFTMRNIYRMLEIVIGTTEQRMEKALLEVFDKLTLHHDENRYNVEGWKNNSHYMVNRKFIMPHVVEANYSGGIRTTYHGWAEPIEDMQKALCFITGTDYDNCTPFSRFLDNLKCEFGQEYSWGFFDFRAYKKGTVHFTFQTEELWGQFNQRIAKIKGYPLFEHKQTKHTDKQDKETAKRYRPQESGVSAQVALIL